MKCNICGTSYEGKFCPNCGAPATTETPVVNAAPSVPVAEAKKKKPIYKKWWFWVIIAIVVIGIIGGSNGDEETPTDTGAGSSITQSNDDTNSSTSDNNLTEDDDKTVSDETETSDDSNKDTSKSYIEDFVSNYNKIAKTPITDRIKFDPKDRESGYYRTEYRLTAWDGSIGEAAKIGSAEIEMVNYGSYGGYYENNSFRIYVTADSVEEILGIFSAAAKVMDPEITDAEIQETIADVKEYGSKNGLTIGDLSGYILQTEMMLD